MKNSWIRVEDKLPELNYIDENWSISSPLLVVRDGGITTAVYETFHGDIRWSGYALYKDVTHWQPLKLP